MKDDCNFQVQFKVKKRLKVLIMETKIVFSSFQVYTITRF